jgi:hypothetical protein
MATSPGASQEPEASRGKAWSQEPKSEPKARSEPWPGLRWRAQARARSQERTKAKASLEQKGPSGPGAIRGFQYQNRVFGEPHVRGFGRHFWGHCGLIRRAGVQNQLPPTPNFNFHRLTSNAYLPIRSSNFLILSAHFQLLTSSFQPYMSNLQLPAELGSSNFQ